ncbi:complex I subunit 4 family protein [Pandoraea pneumonica]|uniref:complex I subunit 4 family protein n=1 Tax=Pandoraea pneumonica TaxID=2508299 RepID=UPI003CE8DADD
MFPILSLLIWTPILAGALIMLLGQDRHPNAVRWTSLAAAVVSALPIIPLVRGFHTRVADMQFVERFRWIASFDASWHVGVDGLSLWLVALTGVTTIIVVLASWRAVSTRMSSYFGSFLVLSGLMQGVFTAQDGMLFFVFFEATLLPLYLLIGVYGRANRTRAAVKFFFFSLTGSLMMLLSMLYLYMQTQSFDLARWHELHLPLAVQVMLFIGFLGAFSVKVPMWPVHTWLPDVHLDGPTGAAVMLGMLKMGGYGLLRFNLPLLPDASHFVASVMVVLSLVAVIYASLVALVQTDLRKLLAYSAVAHMGLVTLGLFLFSEMGTDGAVMQMISYGIVSGAMLLCTGMLYDRTGSSSIDAYGGVAATMPRFAAFAMLFSMANVGMPGTSGFVGEFLVLMAAIKANFWIGALASLTLVLSAAYTLWMYKRVIFGRVGNKAVASLGDVSRREFALLGAMAVMVLAIGLDPKPLTDGIDATAIQVVQGIEQHRLAPNDPGSSEVAGRRHGDTAGHAAVTVKGVQPDA